MSLKRLSSALFALALLFGQGQFASAASKTSATVSSNGKASPTVTTPIRRPPPRIDGIKSTGGDWESSGGTGVACFKSDSAAKRFDALLAAKAPLDSAIIDEIDSLVTLESWERTKETFPQAKTADELLARLQKRLNLYASIVGRQLELIDDRIHVDAWNETEQLETTDDAKPRKPIVTPETPNCRQIQLAVRKALRGPREVRPELHVYFDPRLHAKLDALNQALLEIHEKIYVLGRQVGHPDSLRTRYLVLRLFDESFWKLADSNPAGMAMSVQNALDFQLGDYLHIFATLLTEQDATPFSPSARFESLRSVVGKLRKEIKRCETANQRPGPIDPELQRQISGICMSTVFKSEAFAESLSNEEAFVFFYRWTVSHISRQIPNIEVTVVDWSSDPEMAEYASSAMANVCGMILHLQGHQRDRGAAFRKAATYCTEAGYKASTLPSR